MHTARRRSLLSTTLSDLYIDSLAYVGCLALFYGGDNRKKIAQRRKPFMPTDILRVVDRRGSMVAIEFARIVLLRLIYYCFLCVKLWNQQINNIPSIQFFCVLLKWNIYTLVNMLKSDVWNSMPFVMDTMARYFNDIVMWFKWRHDIRFPSTIIYTTDLTSMVYCTPQRQPRQHTRAFCGDKSLSRFSQQSSCMVIWKWDAWKHVVCVCHSEIFVRLTSQ